MDKNIDVIAIDGPAASGKSTVARLVAEKLGYLYLDTGCMYRAVTLAALQAGIDVADEMAVTQLTQQIEIEVLPAQDEGDGRHYTTLLNGKDVTWDLRLPEVDANVSQVASYKGVREELVRRQRAYGRRGHVVMVGRDIGTVVMPDAPLKLYITASPEERARRRWLDRQKQGFSDDFDAILADVIRRDRIDSNRQHSPLRPADDVIIMDTTERSVAEIVDEIVGMAASGVR
ncbi:MAG TPA: (d)CMP kinase [Anaerolineae bacterium]|nr:(d)CMP kinase [Anaerolineae bacterium]